MGSASTLGIFYLRSFSFPVIPLDIHSELDFFFLYTLNSISEKF